MNSGKNITKNALLNVIKQLCAIIFPLITFPYATRILGVDNFGKVNFTASIVSYISLLASLGISNYAIREGAAIKNDKKKLLEFSNQIFSINILSMFFSYLLMILLIIFWPKLKGYSILLIIQSSSVFFTTIGTDWINSIYEDYKYITIRYIISQVLSLILMFIFVKNSDDYLLYALVMISSSIIANILNYIYVRKKYGMNLKFVREMNYKKHLKPILILFGTAVSSIIYVNSDITILGIMKSEDIVGIYSVSAKIYSIAKQLLGALLVVTIPRISSEIATKTIDFVRNRLEEIFSYIIMITGPASVGMFMLSRNIVYFLSGNEYIQATTSLKILSIALVFAILVTFYVYVILIPFKKEKIALFSTMLSAFVNLLLNIVLIPIFSEKAAAFTTLLSELITMIIGIIYVRKIVKLNTYKPLLVGIVNSIITFIVCKLVLSFEITNLLQIVFSVVIVGLITLLNIAIFHFTKKKNNYTF